MWVLLSHRATEVLRTERKLKKIETKSFENSSLLDAWRVASRTYSLLKAGECDTRFIVR